MAIEWFKLTDGEIPSVNEPFIAWCEGYPRGPLVCVRDITGYRDTLEMMPVNFEFWTPVPVDPRK